MLLSLPALAQTYQRPVSAKLNPTGRAITMSVPVEDDGRTLGEVPVRIEPDDRVLVSRAGLAAKLAGAVDPQRLEALKSAGAGGDMVGLDAIKASGIALGFDASRLALRLAADPDTRPVTELSAGHGSLPVSSVLARPALVSGYLNLIAGVDHVWTGSSAGMTSPRLDMDGVFRMWNIVLDSGAALEGDVDGFTCPVGAKCVYEHRSGLKRRHTRLVYDLPDQLLRVQIGDVETWGEGFQRAPDVLGVTIEKSPRKLRPGESIRPTGRSSFRIERPSEVEVVVNGAIIQRLRLRPGNYNLTDLPLVTGGNEIELVITDDTGQRRSLNFSTFYDGDLLVPGKSEWSVSAGVASYFRDNERQYLADEHFATAFYRQGLTDQLTGEVNLQADTRVAMAGAGVITATPWGFFGLQGAVSHGDIGTGGAARIDWDLINYKGVIGALNDVRETLKLGAEYRSSAYRVPGDLLVGADGILFPQHQYWLRLSGAYSVPIGWNVVAAVSARYQFADDKAWDRTPYRYVVRGDRYGVDLTLSAPLSANVSGSLTLGYSNESYLRYFSRPDSEDEGDFRVMARIYVRASERTRITAGFDTLTKQSTVAAYSGVGRGLDRWETHVDAQHYGLDERATGAAAVGYWGNRFEARVAHTAALSEVGTSRLDPTITDQRTSARFGTSIAYADGQVAIGQPIRGHAFAIVHPHESLAGRQIAVGAHGDVRARADGWGAAVIPDLPAYVQSTLPLDVADLPVGYSLGAGVFELVAPYKAGYALQVGSDFAVSAFGTLIGHDGQPLSLLTGTARLESGPARTVPVFTNRAGRFAAEGLAPGRWIVEMATEERPTTYVLDVPKGSDGLYRAGTLTPRGRPRS